MFQLAVKLRQTLRKTWELWKGIISTRSGLAYQQPDTSSEDLRDTPEAPTNSRGRRQCRTRETDHVIDLDEHILLDEEGVRQYLRIGLTQYRDHVERLPDEIRRHPTLSFVDTFLTRFNRHIDTLNFPYAPRFQEAFLDNEASLLPQQASHNPEIPPYSPVNNSYEQGSPTPARLDFDIQSGPVHASPQHSERDERTGNWSPSFSPDYSPDSPPNSPPGNSRSPVPSPNTASRIADVLLDWSREHRGSCQQDSTPEELNESESEEELEPTDRVPPQATRLHCIGLQPYPRSPRSAEL